MDRIALGKSLNLSIDLISQGRLNRPGRSLAPTFITIHNTSNTSVGADAQAHARFVTKTGYYPLSNGKSNPVSWHFTVDDERVITPLPQQVLEADDPHPGSLLVGDVTAGSGV